MINKNPKLKIYNETISNQDGKEYEFIVTNNYQSSSILELQYHKKAHPHIHEISRKKVKSITIDTFYQKEGVDPKKYNFINIDIQGAELLALKGMIKNIQYVDYFYLEVNQKYLYKDCALINEIDSFLDKYGFKRMETKMTRYSWGDAFYIKSHLIDL